MDRSSSTSSSSSSAVAKRLWHILRVVLYMIRKGFTKQKLVMELNLLLKRGKLAGKALRNLMTFHHHPHGGGSGTRRHRSADPTLSYHTPKEVEFSCSNTPSFFSFHKDHQHGRHDSELHATMIAKAFEMLNSEIASDGESSVMPSPSVTPLWSICWKSPAVVARQLRITDSPFTALKEDEEEADGHVDVKAEEFIKRFYENLQLQQRIPETPSPANWRRRRDNCRA